MIINNSELGIAAVSTHGVIQLEISYGCGVVTYVTDNSHRCFELSYLFISRMAIYLQQKF